MRRLPIIHLEPGMIVAEDILYHDCPVLLKNTQLTKKHIDKLSLFTIPEIPVCSDQDQIISILPKELVLYKEAQETVHAFFQNIKFNQPLNMGSVDQVVQDITSSVYDDEHTFFQLSSLKNKDNYTYFHCLNVCIYAIIMAKHLHFSKEDTYLLSISALLHDIGKAHIPDGILLKPAKLSPTEFLIMRNHTVEGSSILKRHTTLPEVISQVALEHHEKWDGTGYPLKKKGTDIHLFSRIIGLVDTYDALTSERVYKPPEPQYKAGEYILSLSGYAYDPELVKVFLNHVAMYPIGATVLLTSGEVGSVVSVPPDVPWRPKVKVILHRNDPSRKTPYVVDLLYERTTFIEKIIKD